MPLYVPSSHGRHAVRLELPERGLYVPLPHSMHTCAPVFSWYEPALHSVHSVGDEIPERVEPVPAGQSAKLDVDDCPLRAQYLPAGTLMHTLWPADGW